MGTKELSYLDLKSDFKRFDLCMIDAPVYSGIIGQNRVVKTMEFGITIKAKGYNIYLAGDPGLGKTTYAEVCAKSIAEHEAVPDDFCYVYNFSDDRCPLALRFKAGRGKQFQDDMNEVIELLMIELPKAFSSADYDKQKNATVKKFQDKKDMFMKKLSDIAKEEDFSIKQSANETLVFCPVVEGKVLNEDEYEELPESEKDIIKEKSDSLNNKAQEIMREIKEHEKITKKDVDDLDYKVGLLAIGHRFDQLAEKYKDCESVLTYLSNIKEDILENIEQFVSEDTGEEESLSSLLPWMSRKSNDDLFAKYKVNLLIDNKDLKGAPVIVDFNPTYYNLIGEVEYENEYGNLITDFMKIKPGLLHKANGGYLILQAQDVLGSVSAWEAIRRGLKTEAICMESLREQLGSIAMSLRPEPIPLNIKILLVGSHFFYDVLLEYDDMFAKLFKLRADFDSEMKQSAENVQQTLGFIKSYCLRENIPLPHPAAIIRVLEYSSRMAERKDYLSTKFVEIAEIIHEAYVWAKLDGVSEMNEQYILKSISEREYRLNQAEEKLTDLIEENFILIDTSGKKIGQINGLAVIDVDNYTFAKPAKITATTYMGMAGIINIEKEAEMSGSIHDKGIQVLTGYLGSTYAKDFPLSLSCRICFEQNYNGIDGDSASSTELYAVLSSLSGIAINQEIAVTGSMNQMGEIQPIGGVTYKVEGFFDLCRKRGLTGSQGVIIPCQNAADLTLKDEVIEAVKKGDFHIYPVSCVDEGIEILMGTSAKLVHENVYVKLKEYYKKSETVRRGK